MANCTPYPNVPWSPSSANIHGDPCGIVRTMQPVSKTWTRAGALKSWIKRSNLHWFWAHARRKKKKKKENKKENCFFLGTKVAMSQMINIMTIYHKAQSEQPITRTFYYVYILTLLTKEGGRERWNTSYRSCQRTKLSCAPKTPCFDWMKPKLDRPQWRRASLSLHIHTRSFTNIQLRIQLELVHFFQNTTKQVFTTVSKFVYWYVRYEVSVHW